MTELPLDVTIDPVFCVLTAALGPVLVDQLTADRLLEIEDILGSRPLPSPAELIDIFIGALARSQDGKRLTPEQIRTLSPAEKADFSEQLINSQGYMYRDQIEERREEDGKTFVRYKDGDVTLPRETDEPPESYFSRAFMAYREKLNSLPSSVQDSIDKLAGWAKPPVLDALAANAAISQSLSKSLAAFQGLRIPNPNILGDLVKGLSVPVPVEPIWSRDSGEAIAGYVPNLRNPAIDTNERLDQLIARIDQFEKICVQTVELVQSMNTASTELLKSFAEGARSTERYAKRSISIALIALLATVVTPAYQTWHEDTKARLQDAATNHIVGEITETQKNASDAIRNAIIIQADRAHADQRELEGVVSGLNEILRALNARDLRQKADKKSEAATK